MGELLFTVEQVFLSYLSNGKKYNIPEYQRGYKWKQESVIKLLEDILHFPQEGTKFYCLQNITITDAKTYDNIDVYNVIDGQQRLTTLIVVLSFLNEIELVQEKLVYSIRKETQHFIQNFILTREIWNQQKKYNWDTIRQIQIKENINYNHQDIFYLFSAADNIDKWFKDPKKKGFSKSKFADKLKKHVRIIINKVPQGNEEKIFANLNTNRVPLDGADLVRAVLITNVALEYTSYIQNPDTKDIVKINESRVKIGWELDAINNWWSQPSIKNYFNRFISIKDDKTIEPFFDRQTYPINNLYALYSEKRLYAETKEKTKLVFNIFEYGQDSNNKKGDDTLEMYHELLMLNGLLQDWYNDRKIYHLLGFLFNQFKEKTNFYDILHLWEINKNRSSFIISLKNKIKDYLLNDHSTEEFVNKKKDFYHDDNPFLIKTLLLLDIISAIENDNCPKLPVFAFSKSEKDIEHIFPQTPHEIEEIKDYLDYLQRYFFARNKKKRTEAKKLIKDLPDDLSSIDEAKRKRIEEFISSAIKDMRTNSIGNLVLLDSSLNRSMKNKPYSIKRAAVVSFFNKGKFIQPHTIKVFSRYFNDIKNENNYDISDWGNPDIDANASHIKNTVEAFFNN